VLEGNRRGGRKKREEEVGLKWTVMDFLKGHT
jgi:hypothetical protein